MKICFTTEKGARPRQEDRPFVFEKGSIRVFGVFDGHGSDDGDGAVISQALVKAFEKMCSELDSDFFAQPALFRRFIRDEFKRVDQWLLETYGQVAIDAGSTASLGFYDSKTNAYFAVNLGDSRTIFFETDFDVNDRGKGARKDTWGQTIDHKPSDVKEVERIEQAGGTVQASSSKSGVARVGGILALSRAFGDFQLKKPYNNKNKNWVSNMPNVTGPVYPKPTFYSVSCSDGVFDQMTNKEVTEYITKTEGSLEDKCKRIVKESLLRWTKNGGKDNVTCVIFELSGKRKR